MIPTLNSYNDLIKAIRLQLIEQSELPADLVLNGFSPDGVDIAEQLTSKILTPVNYSKCCLVFYVIETNSSNNVAFTDSYDDMIQYQTYFVQITMYGVEAIQKSRNLHARLLSENVRQKLRKSGIHVVRVDDIEDSTDFINNVNWHRKDFKLTISIRTSIPKVSNETDMSSAEITVTKIDYL